MFRSLLSRAVVDMYLPLSSCAHHRDVRLRVTASARGRREELGTHGKRFSAPPSSRTDKVILPQESDERCKKGRRGQQLEKRTPPRPEKCNGLHRSPRKGATGKRERGSRRSFPYPLKE